ncbi:MAG: peptidylprolyl isomerase [Candidatus Falkowbacteria bacterium]|nr:peptidylprolyl isomerase [Candidatus Falkowbacteria bacterium]
MKNAINPSSRSSKKILFAVALFIVAVSVSACANSADIPADMTDTADTNDVNINNSANAIVTPDTSVIDASAPVNPVIIPKQSGEVAAPVVNNTPMKTLDGQEDLFAQYSQALIKTNYSNITVKLYGADSPITVNNFLNLAKKDFYNGTKFHRVIKDFMIQGGDPLSRGADLSVWGTGGPGYKFNDEINAHKLVAGSLAMANSGSNTNGSQFFIVTAPATSWLDGIHTNFGEVVAGMDVVKKIEAVETVTSDRPAKDVVISSIELLK